MPVLSVTVIALAIGASAMTYLGGRVALMLNGRVALLSSLTAGMILGIALFDLLPEALSLGQGLHSPRTLLLFVAIGLLGNMLLDRSLALGGSKISLRPHLGPASLTIHSFFDGVGIGLAFQVSFAAGIVIAIAVLAHDFADGVNTVRLSLAGNRRSVTHVWLIADSVAPVFGALLGIAIALDHASLVLILGILSGAFLYIGAREMIQLNGLYNQRLAPGVAIAVGMAFIYGIVHLAG